MRKKERVSGRFIMLGKLIELKTSFREGEDFTLMSPTYATKQRKNPRDWALVIFIKSKISTEEKKEKITAAMLGLSIYPPQDTGKYFYLRVPSMETRLMELIPESTISEINLAEEIDACKSKLLFLSNLHKENKIFGVMEKKQDLECKVGKYFYYDGLEAKRAFTFFSKLDFPVKNGNNENSLMFELENFEPNSFHTSKLKIKERDLEIDMCIWVIKELCGKNAKTTTLENVLEIPCSEIESFQIITEVEKYGFDIKMNKQKNGFNASINLTNSKMKKNGYLLTILRNIFRENGLPLLQDFKKGENKIACLQLNVRGERESKVSANYGTLSEKQEIIRRAREIILTTFPESSAFLPGETKTNIVVSIPGIINPPVKIEEGKEGMEKAAEKTSEVSIVLTTKQLKKIIGSAIADEEIIASVVSRISKKYLFVNKENPMVPALLAFPTSPFSSPDEVIK
ncbi:MAG: hypothetical protein WCI93_00200 [bacterium]